jgi:hypothetical protein
MSKKPAKSSKPPNASRAHTEHRSERSQGKTTSPTGPVKDPVGIEHENPETEPRLGEKTRASNDGTHIVNDSEHPTTDQARSEAGPAARQNAEFVRNRPSFVRSDDKIPPEFDGKPEGKSAFESKSQQLMEKLRSQGMSIAEIAKLWDMSKAGVHARVGHVEPEPSAPPPDQQTSTNTLPPSSLSQLTEPVPTASPPRIVEVTDETNDTGHSDFEADGNGYVQPSSYRRDAPLLPIVDQQTINELIMSFGGDMRRLGYSRFADFFRDNVIPRFTQLEYWEAHIPGRTAEEKTKNLKRYLWIASKQIGLQREYAQYENAGTANNGSGLKEEES